MAGQRARRGAPQGRAGTAGQNASVAMGVRGLCHGRCCGAIPAKRQLPARRTRKAGAADDKAPRTSPAGDRGRQAARHAHQVGRGGHVKALGRGKKESDRRCVQSRWVMGSRNTRLRQPSLSPMPSMPAAQHYAHRHARRLQGGGPPANDSQVSAAGQQARRGARPRTPALLPGPPPAQQIHVCGCGTQQEHKSGVASKGNAVRPSWHSTVCQPTHASDQCSSGSPIERLAAAACNQPAPPTFVHLQ